MKPEIYLIVRKITEIAAAALGKGACKNVIGYKCEASHAHLMLAGSSIVAIISENQEIQEAKSGDSGTAATKVKRK